MRFRAPKISIRLDVSTGDFQQRIAELAATTGDFETHFREESLIKPLSVRPHPMMHEKDATDDIVASRILRYQILELRPTRETPQRDLVIQIIGRPMEPRVDVRLLARPGSWGPDLLSYERYVETARRLLGPLLTAYNRSYFSRRRMRIGSQAACQSKLPAKAKLLFDDFVNNALPSCLDSKDWLRFYRFIRHCHWHARHIGPDDLMELLVAHGFSDEDAYELATVFDHGLGLLSVGTPYGVRSYSSS